jgi:hypothetical protein
MQTKIVYQMELIEKIWHEEHKDWYTKAGIYFYSLSFQSLVSKAAQLGFPTNFEYLGKLAYSSTVDGSRTVQIVNKEMI